LLDENQLYKKWHDARGKEREDLREELYYAVKKHAASLVWKKAPEDRDLPHDIAAAVICRLEGFKRRCKFSTWVHAISARQIDEALRKKIRSRAVFDETKIVEDRDVEAQGKLHSGVSAIENPNLDQLIGIKAGLPTTAEEQCGTSSLQVQRYEQQRDCSEIRNQSGGSRQQMGTVES